VRRKGGKLFTLDTKSQFTDKGCKSRALIANALPF
jgi:hypothetical protein